MKIKRSAVLILVFSSGLALGVAVTHHPAQGIPPSFYKSEAYFSPDGGIKDRLVRAIDESANSIDMAVFNVTSRDLKLALERAKKRGVSIRIITDSQQVKDAHSEIFALRDEGFNIKLVHGPDKGIMHDKFAVFDGRLLVTGSYNWTYSAQRYNYENAVFMTDPGIIKRYQKEFDGIWDFN